MKILNHNNAWTWKLSALREISYDVIETQDLFNPSNPALLLGKHDKKGKRLIVVEENLRNLLYDKVENYFETNGIKPNIISINTEEENKNINAFIELTRYINTIKLDRRNEPIIAIGGGVLSDVVGFTASCYRRGLPYIKVPTTLMGYVDAGLAIKTSVDFEGHKNRVGAFYPPLACILDKVFLKTLPLRQIRNGCGEILKLGVIRDRTLFELLEKEGLEAMQDHFQTKGEEILRRSVQGMLELLEEDFFENNLTAILTFGHNFSPILEMKDLKGILHGEAVMVEVCFCSVMAMRRGLIDRSTLERIIRLTLAFEFPLKHHALTTEFLWESLGERTLHHGGLQRVPLPTGIGSATFVNDITKEEISQSIDEMNQIVDDLTKVLK